MLKLQYLAEKKKKSCGDAIKNNQYPKR